VGNPKIVNFLEYIYNFIYFIFLYLGGGEGAKWVANKIIAEG
jgi:hypothetical protein